MKKSNKVILGEKYYDDIINLIIKYIDYDKFKFLTKDQIDRYTKDSTSLMIDLSYYQSIVKEMEMLDNAIKRIEDAVILKHMIEENQNY